MLEQQIYKETLATTCAEEAVCTGGTQGPFWALGAKGLAAFKVEKCPMCSLGSEEPILVAFFFFFFSPYLNPGNITLTHPTEAGFYLDPF